MYRRKLKPFVIPLIYSMAVIAFVTSLFFLRRSLENPVFNENQDDDVIYVTDSIFDNKAPVIGEEKVVVRPYTDSSMKIIKYFYDYTAVGDKQQKSLIYYQNTYMQNSGVDYSNGKEKFDVVAILDGTVINVTEDNLLGKVVEVRHTNDLISSYQSLSEITVKNGDTVKQGQIIGKSGTANIAADLKDHLHFEILYKGKVVDPETFYDKNVKDL